LLEIAALWELETEAFRCTGDNICKSVTNKIWLDVGLTPFNRLVNCFVDRLLVDRFF
jgi:hypothetical protein